MTLSPTEVALLRQLILAEIDNITWFGEAKEKLTHPRVVKLKLLLEKLK